MLENPKHLVKQGYDQLGSRYRTHFEKTSSQLYKDWLTEFIHHLPANANVLELGCADGIPTARYLSQHVSYLGIDISPVQIEQARVNVPHAQFEVADMAMLTFPALAFDGVIAFYSIIHLPISEQPTLFNAIYQWLRPDGHFLCIVGDREWTGTESDWIEPGTRMYWSHTDAETYQSWFFEIGFTIVDRRFIAEGEAGHTFFLLKK